MTDELLNGTNRVVLDGVMTEKECDRILQLAKVCWGSGDESDLALKKSHYCSVFSSFFTECSFSRGRLQGTTVSTHSSRDTGGAECSQGSKSKFIFVFTSECHVKWMQTGPEVFAIFVSNPNVLSFKNVTSLTVGSGWPGQPIRCQAPARAG